MQFGSVILLSYAMVLVLVTRPAVAQPAATRPALVVGTLQSRVDRVPQVRAAGVTLATVSLSWDRFQPRHGEVNPDYAREIREQIAAFRKAGQQVQIDFGMQYPPAWVKGLPDSRYVNQFKQPYLDERPGADIVNGVFNPAIRELQAAYVAMVFGELGDDFYAVRLGWNYYGELGYPAAKFKDRVNCFWASDVHALKTAPVAWQPDNAEQTRKYLNWYLDSLADYLKFQIATVRQHYRGRLVVLLGSWGIRPAMLDKGMDPNQTELSLGYDFQRLVKAIDDRNTAVCTTWIDADPRFGDDPPVRALAELARRHSIDLWAENTGRANGAAMRLSVDRARQYGVSTLVWAFEPDLFDGQHASLAELAEAFKR